MEQINISLVTHDEVLVLADLLEERGDQRADLLRKLPVWVPYQRLMHILLSGQVRHQLAIDYVDRMFGLLSHPPYDSENKPAPVPPIAEAVKLAHERPTYTEPPPWRWREKAAELREVLMAREESIIEELAYWSHYTPGDERREINRGRRGRLGRRDGYRAARNITLDFPTSFHPIELAKSAIIYHVIRNPFDGDLHNAQILCEEQHLKCSIMTLAWQQFE